MQKVNKTSCNQPVVFSISRLLIYCCFLGPICSRYLMMVGGDPMPSQGEPVNYTQKDPRTQDFPEIRAPAAVSQERSNSSVAERRSSESQGRWLKTPDGRTAVCNSGSTTLNHLLQHSEIFFLSPEVHCQTQSTCSCEGRPRLHCVLH